MPLIECMTALNVMNRIGHRKAANNKNISQVTSEGYHNWAAMKPGKILYRIVKSGTISCDCALATEYICDNSKTSAETVHLLLPYFKFFN